MCCNPKRLAPRYRLVAAMSALNINMQGTGVGQATNPFAPPASSAVANSTNPFAGGTNPFTATPTMVAAANTTVPQPSSAADASQAAMMQAQQQIQQLQAQLQQQQSSGPQWGQRARQGQGQQQYRGAGQGGQGQSVGSPNYTGCHNCGDVSHQARNCPFPRAGGGGYVAVQV